MFQWSSKVNKSVTFASDPADQELLERIEVELVKYPYKTFSDLCKEALRQALMVSEPVRPNSKTDRLEQQMSDLQRQITHLEQDLGNRNLARLTALESRVSQLTQQMAELALTLNRQPSPASQAPMGIESAPEMEILPAPVEVDPAIARISQFIDDF